MRIVTGRGTSVEEYSLQYECRFGDDEDWVAVRRYDNSHNEVHVHVFHPDDEEPRRILYAGLDAKAGLELARQELRQDWRRFRREYEQRRVRPERRSV